MTIRLLLLALLAPAAVAAAEDYGPYRVSVVRVVDGDTIEVDVRLWPGLSARTSLRLAGVNTPERRGPECEVLAGAAAMRFTEAWLAGARGLTVSDVRPDKYGGRMLGRLRRADGADLARALLVAGHARLYYGQKRTAWCL